MTVPIAAASPTDNGSFNVPNPCLELEPLQLMTLFVTEIHGPVDIILASNWKFTIKSRQGNRYPCRALCVCVCVLVFLQLHFGIMLVSHIASPPPLILDSRIIA
jgi:hypothetical protein